MLRSLFFSALLPEDLMKVWNTLDDSWDILPLKIKDPEPVQTNRDSWFSYLMPSYSETLWEPTEGEFEYSRRTCRCIAACGINEIFQNRFSETNIDSFTNLMEVIMDPGEREAIEPPVKRSG